MTSLRPPSDAKILEARYVVKELDKAAAALQKAHQFTSDKTIADGCRDARRKVTSAARRARRVLEHVGGAVQSGLFE